MRRYNRFFTRRESEKIIEEEISEIELTPIFSASQDRILRRIAEEKKRRNDRILYLIGYDENMAKAYDWGLIRLYE